MLYRRREWAMVFNVTFINISAISWRSVLLEEKTAHMPQVTDKLDQIMLFRVHLAWAGFEVTTLVVIGTDCIGSYKSYHTITSTTAPWEYWWSGHHERKGKDFLETKISAIVTHVVYIYFRNDVFTKMYNISRSSLHPDFINSYTVYKTKTCEHH